MTVTITGGVPRIVSHVARMSAVCIVGLVMALPILYLISASLMSQSDVRAYPPHFIPPRVVWHNYVLAYHFLSARVIVNSLIFTIAIVGIQLAITLPAGFALASMRFRWTGIVLAIIVVPMFVPSNMTLIPTYVVTYELKMVGSYAGMILPVACQTAFAMLLFRQAFADLPPGLIEAARIDGANWFRVLISIAVPLIKPAIAAFCSISILTAWNLYIWPQLVAPDEKHRVLTVALAPLASGQYSLVSPSVGLAAAVISMAPMLVVFVMFQKWFIKGVIGSGVD